MQAKTGGAIAIGTVTVAITYFASSINFDAPSQPVPASDTLRPALSTSEVRDSKSRAAYKSVTVFYATDRALAGASRSDRQVATSIACFTTALGLIAFSAWFAHRGHRNAALASGGLATAAIVALIFPIPALLTKRGISEAYVSGCRYGTDRGETALGYCDVSIPNSHRSGELESPSILRLELRTRPDQHVMLQRVVPQNGRDFYEAVRRRVQTAPQHDLFVFVHGFNVSFESAARRTAQIAHDLDYAGAPIFFSWPSQGKTWRYTVDETNITWAVPHLKSFLTELAQSSNAQAINLIAHSMGNRALTQAIHELGCECKQEKKLFQQVILAAPDIDADVFRDQLAPSLARYSSRVTLYASANDEALAASKLVHGSRRAGESVLQPVAVPGVETIDVATTDLGPLGHSYYGSCPLILQDLAVILREARPAAHRPWLAPMNGQGTTYWRLSDGAAVAASDAGPSSLAR